MSARSIAGGRRQDGAPATPELREPFAKFLDAKRAEVAAYLQLLALDGKPGENEALARWDRLFAASIKLEPPVCRMPAKTVAEAIIQARLLRFLQHNGHCCDEQAATLCRSLIAGLRALAGDATFIDFWRYPGDGDELSEPLRVIQGGAA